MFGRGDTRVLIAILLLAIDVDKTVEANGKKKKKNEKKDFGDAGMLCLSYMPSLNAIELMDALQTGARK
jgi:hypothetical protein